ncbi:MAG TPA: leucine-rich repeat domain-containing protein [Clostridiales bacterium]|nr:MAG: hypothetical protein BWY37_00482 [Firmicutes bacterium ADurb.Bin262]HOU09248.1 leucine-rich repeat domain-containing protein [Clostridiales bacterium]HQK72698.1 leucine-rich repeat domain-containing protein [Clostridiales bacterium]
MKRIRKAAAVFIAAVVLLSLFGCAGLSESIKYKNTDGGLALFRYSGIPTVDRLTIPAEKDGKPVVEIMEFAVSSAEYLKTVTIGKNIRKIAQRAFTNCPALEAYKVENGNAWFETDGSGVLYTKGKKALVAYPCARVKLEKDSGGNIIKGAEFDVPPTVTEIRDAAFYLCGNLTKITFPEGLRKIGNYAFMKCENLSNFTFPESLAEIGRDAFSYCDSLTRVTLPENTGIIGDYAFFSLSSSIEKIVVLCPQNKLRAGKDWVPKAKGQVNVEVPVEYR